VTVTGNDPINLILPTVLANTPAYVTALTTAISNQSVVQNDLDRIMILFVPPITRDGLGRVNYNLILNQPGSAAILANLYNQLIVLPAASRAAYLRNLASNATPGTSQYVIYNTLASALTSGPLPPLNNVMIVANILALLNVPQSSFSAALYNQLVSQLTSDLLSIQNTLTTLFPNNFVGARNYVQQQASNFQLSSSLRGAYVLFYQTFASTPPLNNLIIVTNTLPYLGTNINNISQTLRQQLVSRSSSDLTTVQNALVNMFPNNVPGAQAYVINNANTTTSLGITYGLYAQTFASIPPLNNLMIVTNTLPYLGTNINNISQSLRQQLVSRSSSDLSLIQDTLANMFQNNVSGAQAYVINNANTTTSLGITYGLYAQTFASIPPLNNLMIVTNTLPYLGTNINNISQTLRQQLVARPTSDLTTIQNTLATLFPNVDNIPAARSYVISQANTTTSLGITYGLYAQTFASIPPLNNLIIVTNTLPYLGSSIDTISYTLRQQLLSRSSSDLSLIQDTLANMFPNNVAGAQAYVINNANNTTSLGITYGLYAQSFSNNKTVIATQILQLINVNPATVPTQFASLVNDSTEANLNIVLGALQSLFPNNIAGARNYVTTQANTFSSIPDLQQTYARVANTFSSFVPVDETATLNAIFVLVGVAPSTVPSTTFNNILTLSSGQTVGSLTFLQYILTQLNAVVPATTIARQNRLIVLRNANFIPEQRAVYDAIIQQFQTGIPTQTNQQLLDQILAILGVSVVQFGVANYNAVINSTDPTVNLALMSILTILQGGTSSAFSVGATQQLRSLVLSGYSSAISSNNAGVSLVWTPLYQALSGL
jgi:predicted amino acid-binding ACT domain protein